MKLLLALTCLAAAQADPMTKPQPPQGGAPAANAVARAEAWPKLEGEAAKSLKAQIERLRRANSPQMAEEASAALCAAGPGIVPELLPALGHEKDPAAVARVEAVLLAVTGPQHAGLLAKEFLARAPQVRAFALERAACFQDAQLREAALSALAKARAAHHKSGPEVRLSLRELEAAALCATSAGALDGFDVVCQMARDRWGARRQALFTALRGVRGDAAAAKAKELLDTKDRQAIVAGLNVLSGCGTQSHTAWVAPFLDSTDNSIRIAAINACRGIVEDQGPIETLPVFEAVELAKKWKARL
jgi:hypothetical protein